MATSIVQHFFCYLENKGLAIVVITIWFISLQDVRYPTGKCMRRIKKKQILNRSRILELWLYVFKSTIALAPYHSNRVEIPVGSLRHRYHASQNGAVSGGRWMWIVFFPWLRLSAKDVTVVSLDFLQTCSLYDFIVRNCLRLLDFCLVSGKWDCFISYSHVKWIVCCAFIHVLIFAYENPRLMHFETMRERNRSLRHFLFPYETISH